MAIGKAPISGGIAIACGVLFVTMVITAMITGVLWAMVLISLGLFVGTARIWRVSKKNDREYQERIRRLAHRLRRH